MSSITSIIFYLGIVFVFIGLAGVLYCLLEARKYKKQNLPKDAMKQAFKKLISINYGAIAFSFLGLGMLAFSLIMR